MLTVVLEAVEVLVPLATNLAAIWLLLLHTNSARVWYGCSRVDYGKGTIGVLLQLLILVTVLRTC